jgi:CubicO group peptidase (beta-lactamase class C family)
LSDPVTDYIPGYEDSRGITIFHLLTHSSGLAEYTAFEGVGDKTKLPTTKKEIIGSFWGKELRFSPGEKFRYCNSNYVLLGQIIEKVSEQSYEDYIEKNIFSPLGMKDSGYDHSEIVLENRAEGYVNIGGEVLNASYIDTSFPNAAGALYSTVNDLHNWYLALTSGKVVSQKLWEEASSTQVDNYGYGFMEGNLYGYRRIYHGGTVNGFKTMINIFPDPDLTVIVLSNLETAEIERINRDLSAITFGEEYEVPQPEEFIEIDDEILESYTGKYAADNGYTVEVSREQDYLILSLMGQPKLEVFPLSETEFSPKGSGLVVEFRPGVDGNVSGMKVTQERRSLEAEKVD